MLVVKSDALPATLPAVADFLSLSEQPPDFSPSGGGVGYNASGVGAGELDEGKDAAPIEGQLRVRLLHPRALTHARCTRQNFGFWIQGLDPKIESNCKNIALGREIPFSI